MTKYRLTDKLKRYRQIVNIVTKYGFDVIVEKTRLSKIFKIPFKKSALKEKFSAPVRARKMLEELGPSFIKLGQILSTRPDLVPLPYITEFEKLQDNTTSVSFEKISAVFRKEIKKDIAEVFSEFKKTPFASASVSQVHKANYNGKQVAVKIQKPGIDEQIRIDIGIMYDIAELIEKFIKEADIYQPVNIVREFEKILKNELDFSKEARNIERFRENFGCEGNTYVPAVYREITGKKVLTLEYIEGIKISRVKELEKAGFDTKKLAEAGLDSVMKQIFTDGFFHGDPHPANILVTRDGKLCFIDFGIVGKISEERRLELLYFLDGLTKNDSSKVVESLEMMGAVKEGTDIKNFREEIEGMLEEYRDIPIKDVDINALIEASFSIMRRYYINIPTNLTLLIKTIATIEGIGLALNPDFNLASGIKPHIIKFTAGQLHARKLLNDIKIFTRDFSRLIKETPASIESFLKMLKKGYISIAFEHKGLHDLISTIDKSSNRLSFSLIIAALIISSSLIMVSGARPYIMGYPALGVIGFLISVILGIWLIIDIIKNRSL